MKTIISWIAGIAIAVLCWIGAAHLIGWATNGIENHDLRLITRIVVWFIAFGLTAWVSIVLGILTGALVEDLLTPKRKPKWPR